MKVNADIIHNGMILYKITKQYLYQNIVILKNIYTFR
jgi:hypothetical protein